MGNPFTSYVPPKNGPKAERPNVDTATYRTGDLARDGFVVLDRAEMSPRSDDYLTPVGGYGPAGERFRRGIAPNVPMGPSIDWTED